MSAVGTLAVVKDVLFRVVKKETPQTMPGYLFNREDDFVFPAFESLYEREGFIHCEGENAHWLIQIRWGLSRNRIVAVREVAFGIGFAAYDAGARPWVIVLDEPSAESRAGIRAMPQGVLLTGRRDWEALEQIL